MKGTAKENFLNGKLFRLNNDESCYGVYQYVNDKHKEGCIKNVKLNSTVCFCEFETAMPDGVYLITEILDTKTRGYLSFKKLTFIS